MSCSTAAKSNRPCSIWRSSSCTCWSTSPDLCSDTFSLFATGCIGRSTWLAVFCIALLDSSPSLFCNIAILR